MKITNSTSKQKFFKISLSEQRKRTQRISDKFNHEGNFSWTKKIRDFI